MTRRSNEASFGNKVATRVRRLISLFLALEHVRRSHSLAMFFGQQKDRQSFRDIVLGPSGDLWRGVLVEFDETLEFFVGVSEIFGVEDVSASPERFVFASRLW